MTRCDLACRQHRLDRVQRKHGRFWLVWFHGSDRRQRPDRLHRRRGCHRYTLMDCKRCQFWIVRSDTCVSTQVLKVITSAYRQHWIDRRYWSHRLHWLVWRHRTDRWQRPDRFHRLGGCHRYANSHCFVARNAFNFGCSLPCLDLDIPHMCIHTYVEGNHSCPQAIPDQQVLLEPPACLAPRE